MMRRNPLCIALAAVLALTLVGCGGSSQEEPAPERPTVEIELPADEGNTVTVGLLSATVPSEWETKDDGDGGLYIYPEYAGMLYISEMDFPESS
ncbi:MAG: hypothetical protein Q4D39_08025, partial [Coriobacteriaceae bacterium]|nr:hypothetical protein [Coriobacteriaceae bacterium]